MTTINAHASGEGGGPKADARAAGKTDPDEIRVQDYVARILRREARAIGRAISEVEDGARIGRSILKALRPHVGNARVVGVTGPPGAGKSTLVGALIGECRRRGQSVGVIAVDPSSSISGGAVLGDRVRMMRNASGGGAFIRSLGSRGHGGALSRATAQVIDILDAAGYDRVIVETVGAGQSDVEAADLSGTLVVVCPPGLGDEVQAIKSGLMEVADIFVVSKYDLPLAARVESDLMQMLKMRRPVGWTPPVIGVAGEKGEGIGGLVDAIDRHERHVAKGEGAEKRGSDPEKRMRKLIASEAAVLVRDAVAADDGGAMRDLLQALRRGEIDDGTAARRAIALAASRLAVERKGR